MKFRKNWKRFWTLDRHHAEGFTLVELIVVIAILAILAGVGTVGYSGYVKKANMTADQTLVSEVANALVLAYYSDPTNATSDYVILKTSGKAEAGSDYAKNAMIAAFGENWEQTLSLSYDGWAAIDASNFSDSSYNDNVDALLGTIDGLTSELAKFLTEDPRIAGENFKNYLAENGLADSDATSQSNAAVTYVANNINELDSAKKEAIVDALVGIGTDVSKPGGTAPLAVGTAMATIQAQTGNSLAAAAIMYAFAEAYCLYDTTADFSEVSLNMDNAKTSGDAAKAVVTYFTSLIEAAVVADISKPFAYFGRDTSGTLINENHQALADAKAAVSAMGALDAASDTLLKNVGSDSCYADSADFVQTYLAAAAKMQAGDVLVQIVDGKVDVFPTEVLS